VPAIFIGSSSRCSDLNTEENQQIPIPLQQKVDWFGRFPLIGYTNGEKVRAYIPVNAACKLSGYNQQIGQMSAQ
jgi:hypothetical protein